MRKFLKKILLEKLDLEKQKKFARLFLKNAIDKSDREKNLHELAIALQEYGVQVEDRLRQLKAEKIEIPERYNFDRSALLKCSIAQEDSPWLAWKIEDYAIPGMLLPEEMQYYNYIGQFYSGQGEIIELGPWLGLSTHHIVQGLIKNPNFASKKVYVFDDFIWRSSWMDRHIAEDERLENHQDFQPLFYKYSSDIQEYLQVTKRKIIEYDGNQDVPQLTWDRGSIELMYIDCGRTFIANEAWYKIFSKFFIPNVTLLIMQDWRQHREIPMRWYNQTKQFTDSKEDKLQLIHEVRQGGIATFLYKG
ncbi:hypothetical protein NIES593_21085 [Hydrococcus rivularis NIES-593]|uniref:Macrocin O-methyltransferase n=1 Tax=Hydrococcus rivularis NIES-593 TaxID=1921803 RepID=A0A1U7H8H7_9CYAN|nr:hypothetical protein [Hydrococcus rivularis]OKH19315.1 hypothetical protein NIES593_21085 [Hydrococcus rivularis NIES-593]